MKSSQTYRKLTNTFTQKHLGCLLQRQWRKQDGHNQANYGVKGQREASFPSEQRTQTHWSQRLTWGSQSVLVLGCGWFWCCSFGFFFFFFCLARQFKADSLLLGADPSTGNLPA